MAAAFLTSHILSPVAAPRRASALSAPRVNRRRSMHPAAIARRIAVAAGAILFFLWTLLAIAFSLLVMADFFV
jgi:hypothetical protein